jgi:hypothetical protein
MCRIHPVIGFCRSLKLNNCGVVDADHLHGCEGSIWEWPFHHQ